MAGFLPRTRHLRLHRADKLQEGLPLIAAALALASVLVTVINPGDLVTFTRPGLLDAVCVRVTSLDVAPGNVPAAWIIYTGDAPVHALHAQLVDLRPGCARP